MPYDTLYETALSQEERPRPQVTLVCASPTAFRSQGRTMLFPLLQLVFGSLMARWNGYAPRPLDAALLESFDMGIDVDRYTLQTQMQDFGRYQLQAGFVGQCTFGARIGVAAEIVWGMRLLGGVCLFRWGWLSDHDGDGAGSVACLRPVIP